MNLWIIYAFASVLFSVTYGLLSKRLLNTEEDHDPIAYASSLFSVVGVLSLIAYLWVGYTPRDFSAFGNTQVLLFLFMNVILYSAAPSLYWRSLKHLPASEVAIMYDLTALYVFVFGISLGTEAFNSMRLFGGLLIVVASIVLGFQTQRKKGLRLNKYFVMLMLATILYALAALTDNIIITRKYFSPLFFQILSFSIPSVLILLLNPRNAKHLPKLYAWRTYKWTLLNGLFFFASFWAIYKAYAVGGATSQVNFVIASETVFMVILAAIFLKERDHLYLKFICAILAVIGMFFLA